MQIIYLTSKSRTFSNRNFYHIKIGEKNYKHFIGYLNNNDKVKPMYIMLPKTSAYVRSYDGKIKWMYFLIKDDLNKK